jgi:RimJ/RimL family protein N-acetyltransferase
MPDNLKNKPYQSIITGQRVTLVRSEPKLAKTFWETILKDREVGGDGWRWLKSEEQLRAYLLQRSPDVHDHDVIFLITKSEEVMGSFHIHHFNYETCEAEVGCAIAKNYEGQGYISESMSLIENELLRLGFKKLIAICATDNSRAIHLVKKHGFLPKESFSQNEGMLTFEKNINA